MEYLAVLGRLPKLSLAELEAQFGEVNFKGGHLATFESVDGVGIDRFGGIVKLGKKVPGGRAEIVDRLTYLPDGKITLGVSDYRGAWARGNYDEGMAMKKELRRAGRSVRLVECSHGVVSSATAHHNQLGEKERHVEVLIAEDGWYISAGVQNITNYARRDRARPARDARVGMLPPKLAQILINLCGKLPQGSRVLDPFCGTGVVLQEAFLMGYLPYGTDINSRMAEYSRRNLDWIQCPDYVVEDGDARSHVWGDTPPIRAVAAEAFLGSPMSRIPGEVKLREEKQNCREIIMGFLRNIHPQIQSGTPIVLAIPAWRRASGGYERIGILDEAERVGYNVEKFKSLSQEDFLYYREGQVVAREIIVLRKK